MNKKNNSFSLPVRIIIYMVTILLFTAGAILLITANHFNNQTKQYHEDILKRKVRAVEAALDYEMDNFPGVATKENIHNILEEGFLRIGDINKTDIVIYDLRGNKILTTQPVSTTYNVLPQKILDRLKNNNEIIITNKDTNNENDIYSSYSNIKNYYNENIAILCLPYQSNQDFLQQDMFTLIGSYGLAFAVIILFGTLAVYFVTKKTLTRLWSFADRIRETEVIVNNMPIRYDGNDEIKVLVDSYNDMLKKLKHQSDLIAKQEREEAWRDFARQVAHEVRNPLTPMRLMIQNHMRKFDINDPNLEEKTMRTGNILLQQIDTISSIAEAFSDFAKMPSRNDEKIDIIDVIKNALYVFPAEYVEFNYSPKAIMMRFDKQYLNRVITNITKNAFQSIPHTRKAKVKVDVMLLDNFVHITIKDNGEGIPVEAQSSIFVPKFTTKNSGMGIGLPMVKKIIDDYDGTIRFESEVSVGTTFYILIPYHE
ncbi:His Kinase A (phospho-acceptor) domain-containing protein [Chishuiella changwenlii]|uniref:histidine kinase n=1 Tax=Chishuiella changwenlii TaxID=1434701 RepID=A0A1M6YUK2_9FLAO|nr:ATP-binding protein [Chishuiella changwenlii]GGE88192.1 two-component sensor histidine kinase [Chishuiella changwenlii]SHL21775.1 His Kinase A (phospho-acceptor) domain-containing protein [Chishuiella changwenlii]